MEEALNSCKKDAETKEITQFSMLDPYEINTSADETGKARINLNPKCQAIDPTVKSS